MTIENLTPESVAHIQPLTNIEKRIFDRLDKVGFLKLGYGFDLFSNELAFYALVDQTHHISALLGDGILDEEAFVARVMAGRREVLRPKSAA